MIWWIIGTAVVIVALVFFSYYNRFVTLKNRIENSMAQINVQLKKRADLVPNLLESVKGYMKHEKSIIAEVTKARKEMMAAGNINKKVAANNKMESALKSIFALAENYPNLKANENFLQLQQEMSAIEDKVAYSRQYYNDNIMSFNTLSQIIPGIWFAKMYGFAGKKYLEITEAEKAMPKIKF
ncbi:LemA family protein [archaeon]|nr:LemA family protein [archaeon]